MSRIVLVSYYFPPIGGAGAQRPAALARLLPERGHDVTVVTASASRTTRWTPRDESLTTAAGDRVEVVRVTTPEPETSRQRLRVDRWLARESQWGRWWQEAIQEVIRRHDGDVDLLYTIMSPYSSAAGVASAAAELGVPWVADLGDPWALDEMMVFPSGLHRAIELRRMRTALSSAAAIVMSTPQAVAAVRDAFPELARTPVVAIPNGYEASDFSGPPPERTDDRFRIVHTGYLHTQLGVQQRRVRRLRDVLGGTIGGVDIYTRSHVYLLRAVERLLTEEPALADRLEVIFAGVLSPIDVEIAARSPVTHTLGYVSHTDAVGLLRSADLLFLPMHKLQQGRRASIVPGKTYEYLASGRPILAAVPEGDARDILAEAGNAYICDPDDVDAMTKAIRAAVDVGAPQRAAAAATTARFEWSRIADDVAEVIDGATGLPTPDAFAPGLPSGRAKRVLYIAYHFPPIGGAGVQRSLRFVQYLREFGFEVTVVTGPGDARGRFRPSDVSLSASSPATDIVRVAGPEPRFPTGWHGRRSRWLARRTVWADWWIRSIEAEAERLPPCDVIVASMSPYESSDAAARLAQRFGVPWIADLRDPWALDEMMVYPTSLHRRLEAHRMRKALRSAAAIVTTAREATKRLRKSFPELAAKPVMTIPNGYDVSDFANAISSRDDGRFRIVHTGYLHTELGLRQRRMRLLKHVLGGTLGGVDIYTRSHAFLLEAVGRLLAEQPELADRLEVVFAGVLSKTDQELAARCPVARPIGYVPHAESVSLLRTADLLFLPMQNVRPGWRATIVPGKTYEYLASGTPILAAVPAGDARDLLEASGNAYVCDPDDVEAMKRSIAAALQGGPARSPIRPAVRRYERRALATRLARLLSSVSVRYASGGYGPLEAAPPSATR